MLAFPGRQAYACQHRRPSRSAMHKAKRLRDCRCRVSSADLLSGLTSEPRFAQLLDDSAAFQHVVNSHLKLHDLVGKIFPLERAPTRVSDESGVFQRSAASAPDPATAPLLRVQTLSSPPSPTNPIDWAHHTFALAPGYCYSKSSVFTADSSLVPHLELEMGATAGSSKVLFYLNMDPRLSLTLRPDYLDHYYLTPPPLPHTTASLPPLPPDATAAAASSDSASGSSSSNPTPSSSSNALRSWSDLEAASQSCPGFTRFSSPSLHVRAFSSTAILFQVDHEGWPAALDVLSEAVAIWLAWCHAGGGRWVDTSPAASAATAAAARDVEEASNLPEDMAARSWAWRRFPRRERAAAFFKKTFGDQVMEDYWDSMAGDARIRLPASTEAQQ